MIGAGVTGISSASHLIGHGFEVTIFEQGSEENLGGIWSRVNSTSGLQISSIMYRWHPAVLWKKGYPKRDEILSNAKTIWIKYGLDKRTRFNTKIESVRRHSSSTKPEDGGHARWVINGEEDTVYDGLVVSTGTCGEPKRMDLPGQEKFKGVITHSSQLDNVELKGKRVLVVGGGASGIEALELAVAKGAKKPTILARSDKWIIPRMTVIDGLLALQPFGRETFLSAIPEFLLRKLHYRGLEEKMAPTQGFYIDTPIVNSAALRHIREGKADYLRGDVKELKSGSIDFNFRTRGQKKSSAGKAMHLDADVIVIATGFTVPKIDFLPDDLFPEDYTRPNLYLQVFPIPDVSVVTTNASFVKAVGTVAHVHIGVYARILALFLMEADTRPPPRQARLWVDMIRYIKENAPGGRLSFFTYMELMLWLVSFLFLRLNRLKVSESQASSSRPAPDLLLVSLYSMPSLSSLGGASGPEPHPMTARAWPPDRPTSTSRRANCFPVSATGRPNLRSLVARCPHNSTPARKCNFAHRCAPSLSFPPLSSLPRESPGINA